MSEMAGIRKQICRQQAREMGRLQKRGAGFTKESQASCTFDKAGACRYDEPVMKWHIFWLILAVLCVVYGVLVMRVGSGTGFFLVWFALGLFFFLLFLAAKMEWWQAIPKPWKAVILTCVVAAAAVFVFVEALIIRGFSGTNEKDLDYLLVLGAQVRESGPSVVLRYRLDAACAYLLENEETVCIVSGGQGYNEPFPEAEGMRDYLLQKGISGDRILVESKSSNTKENMLFGSRFFDPDHDRVGIVTNQFHIFRACALAKKAGIKHAYPIPAGSTPLYLPNNMLREFLGVIKDFLAGNI